MTKERFATISIRVSPKERKSMIRTAKYHERTLSEWLRLLAFIDIENVDREREANRRKAG
jgi:hypothetical protein